MRACMVVQFMSLTAATVLALPAPPEFLAYPPPLRAYGGRAFNARTTRTTSYFSDNTKRRRETSHHTSHKDCLYSLHYSTTGQSQKHSYQKELQQFEKRSTTNGAKPTTPILINESKVQTTIPPVRQCDHSLNHRSNSITAATNGCSADRLQSKHVSNNPLSKISSQQMLVLYHKTLSGRRDVSTASDTPLVKRTVSPGNGNPIRLAKVSATKRTGSSSQSVYRTPTSLLKHSSPLRSIQTRKHLCRATNGDPNRTPGEEGKERKGIKGWYKDNQDNINIALGLFSALGGTWSPNLPLPESVKTAVPYLVSAITLQQARSQFKKNEQTQKEKDKQVADQRKKDEQAKETSDKLQKDNDELKNDSREMRKNLRNIQEQTDRNTQDIAYLEQVSNKGIIEGIRKATTERKEVIGGKGMDKKIPNKKDPDKKR